MPGLLEPIEHHDSSQIADMKALRCRVKPDIGGLHALGQLLIKSLKVASLMDKAALVEYIQKVGFVRHDDYVIPDSHGKTKGLHRHRPHVWHLAGRG